MIDMLFAPLSPAESAKASADWAPPAWWPDLDERRVIVEPRTRRVVRIID